MLWPPLFVCLALISGQPASTDPQNTQNIRLVPEGGAAASMKNGTLDLRSGSGWLRFPRPVLDFDLAFEIRALTSESDAGLIVRTWTGWEQWPDVGYRLTLPAGAALDPSRLLQGRRMNVVVLEQGSLNLRPAGEWQRVEVMARGSSLRLVVNDELAGEFELESYGGFVMFDNRKGRVELRDLSLRTPELNERIPAELPSPKQIEAAGGQAPRVIHEVKPVYTPEALRSLTRGAVSMKAVVLADGTVGAVRLIRNRHPDLDISAIAALKGWRFRPATLEGRPVPVVVDVEITFSLR